MNLAHLEDTLKLLRKYGVSKYSVSTEYTIELYPEATVYEQAEVNPPPEPNPLDDEVNPATGLTKAMEAELFHSAD